MAGALLAAWLSSGAAPLADALGGAVAPSDFATDFVPAARIWRGESTTVDVQAGNAEATRLGAPGYAEVGVPFGAHPPPSVLLVAALVPLGFPAAALAWLALSLGGLAVLAWVLAWAVADAAGMTGRRRTALAAGLFAALSLWPPVLHNIEKGQWSLILAGLLSGAWWAAVRGRDRLAGALIAVAGSFKVIPLLLLAAFARPGRRRGVVGGAAATLGVVIALSSAILGPAAWLDFATSVPANTRGWQTGPANTLSLWGALARLLVGGPFARPLATAPALPFIARGVWALAAIALLVLVWRNVGRRNIGATFAAWTVLAVVLSPLSWSHAAILLVLPVALLALSAGPRPRVALAFAIIVLTIPRSTLFALAGPLPVSPGRGLALAAHLAAALAVLIVAFTRPIAEHTERNGTPVGHDFDAAAAAADR